MTDQFGLCDPLFQECLTERNITRNEFMVKRAEVRRWDLDPCPPRTTEVAGTTSG